ncbi:hypothetical protein CF54_28525 [Streptomyces sp. Tu 6176]|nr:hypothetical protein CF54_28525 [Streptomyces sp. Tu 6176]
MRTGVGQQVDQHLLEACRVRRHRGRFAGQVEPPGVAGTGRPRVADGVHDQRQEVGRLEAQRPARVQPGEQQQILHQQRHPVGLGLDTAQRVPGVRADPLAAAPGEFGVAADRGERGAQLVAGVRDELADPRLAALPCVQGAVDVVEHAVEREADLSDLGARVGLRCRDAFAEVHLARVQGEFGDPGGGGGDPAQRAQRDADDGGTGERGGDEPGDGDADLHQDEGPYGVVDLRGRYGHVEAAVGAGGVDDAVAAQAGQVDGVLALVLGDGAERGALVGGEGLGVHLRDPGVVPGLVADLGLGDGAVLGPGHDGAAGLRPLDEVAEPDVLGLGGAEPLVGGPLLAGPARRPEHTGGARGDLAELPVELFVQMGAERQGRHRADDPADHGDQHDGRDDEPGPQGARLPSAPGPPEPLGPLGLLGPPWSAVGHDTAGLIRYPAPRRVWIIGSRPASILRRR